MNREDIESERHKFVLRKLDPETGSFTEQELFTIRNLAELEILLSTKVPEVSSSIPINSEQYQKLVDFYLLRLESIATIGELIHLHPETVHDPHSHTGRELLLMLTGKKPFASFSEVLPNDTELRIIPERYFEPYVTNGRIKRIEHFEELTSKNRPLVLRRVFYAMPGEEWRANATIMLYGLARKYGWRADFELVEGFLLGYDCSSEVGTGKVDYVVPEVAGIL
jgi:hypothetical protein